MDDSKVTYRKQKHVTVEDKKHHHNSHHHDYVQGVLACVVVSVCVVGAWAAAGDGGGGHEAAACTPCNSKVEVDNLTLPYVGFVCVEAETLLHAPYTCLVSFVGAFNVVFYLHHVPASLVVVSRLCCVIFSILSMFPMCVSR